MLFLPWCYNWRPTAPSPVAFSDRYCFQYADVEVSSYNNRCKLVLQDDFGTRHLAIIHVGSWHWPSIWPIPLINVYDIKTQYFINHWWPRCRHCTWLPPVLFKRHIPCRRGGVFCWLSSSLGVIYNSKTSQKNILRGSILDEWRLRPCDMTTQST